MKSVHRFESQFCVAPQPLRTKSQKIVQPAVSPVVTRFQELCRPAHALVAMPVIQYTKSVQTDMKVSFTPTQISVKALTPFCHSIFSTAHSTLAAKAMSPAARASPIAPKVSIASLARPPEDALEPLAGHSPAMPVA